MTTLSAKTRYILMAAWSILAASSCTNDNEPETSPTIAFQPTVQTRAVKESFTTNDAFTVWGGYDNDATNVFNGETVTNNGGNNWSYTGTRYWVSGKTYNFYAIYPTGYGTCSQTGTLTIHKFDTSTNKGDQAIDLMTAEALGRSGSNPAPVPFTFRHELARVQVVAQCDPGVSASDIQTTFSGFRTKGTLIRNATTTSWNDLDGVGSFTGNIASLSSNSEESLYGDMLLIPQDINNEVQLSVSLKRGNTPLSGTFSLSDASQSWEAGQTYRYTIRIEVDAITFSNFTVDKWGETNAGGDINIEQSDNQ